MTATVDVVDVVGGLGADERRALAAVAAEDGGTALVIRVGVGGSDALRRWVREPVVRIVAALRDLLGQDAAGGRRRCVAILLSVPAAMDDRVREGVEALLEALRGIAHSATLEPGAQAIRVDVVAYDEAALDDACRTLAYLMSAGAFAAGSTIDLRSPA